MYARDSSLLLVLTLGVAAVASSARADTLVLQDGRRVPGQLVSVSRGWVEFQPLQGEDASHQLRVAIADVRSIQFDDAAESSGRTTFEIGRGEDRAEPQETVAGGRRRRPRGDEEERDGVGGRDVTIASRDTRATRDDRRRGRMITVPTTVRWTDSGIDVAADDVVSFSVAGNVTLGDDRSLGAEGDLDAAAPAPRRPLPDRPAGALIGRIGTSPDDTFFIGAERLPFRVRTGGRLYLGINDDTLYDDSGAFQVAVTR